MSSRLAILSALGAALLFGASTPFAKWLTVDISPPLLASLLYLGSGLDPLVGAPGTRPPAVITWAATPGVGLARSRHRTWGCTWSRLC